MSPPMNSKPRETGWPNRIAEAWLWLMIQILYYKPHHFLSHPLGTAVNNHAISTLPTTDTTQHTTPNTHWARYSTQLGCPVCSVTCIVTPGNIRWWFYINNSKRVDKNPVNIVTRLWDGQSRIHILGGARDFSLLNVQTGSRAHTAS